MSVFDDLLAQGRIRAGVELGGLTTYRLGGPAAYLMDSATRADLTLLAAALASEPHPVLVLGRGSNLVISERGFEGVVVRLGPEFASLEVSQESVTLGGAVPLPQAARAAASAGRRGLEFLIGVPGSAGGGVRQNAGCFGAELVDVLESAQIFDLLSGREKRVTSADLDLQYRHSSVASTDVILAATLKVWQGDAAEGLELIRTHTRWRRLHQPGGTLNAGSVFKNPPGDSAGRIIDEVGLKGLRVGGAEVSPKHANFFVAMPGTKASDVYGLVLEVARRVEEATGLVLEPEIQFVGEFEDGP